MFRRSRFPAMSLLQQKNDKIGDAIPQDMVTQAGRLFRRKWVFRNENWCSLCNEPIAVWGAHSGRRDHTLQEGTYSQFVDYPRTWDSEKMFRTFETELGHEIGVYHRKYAFEMEGTRRSELMAMLCWLRDRRVIDTPPSPFDHKSWLKYHAPSLFGALWSPEVAMRRYVTPSLLRLFPYGEISYLSGFMDFITVSYNLESVYDLCGFSEIDPNGHTMGISSPLAYGLTWSTAETKDAVGSGGKSSLSPVAAAAAAEAQRIAAEKAAAEKAAAEERRAAKRQDQDEDGREQTDDDSGGGFDRGFDNTHSKKANFVRQILGQLRFALEAQLEGSKEHPKNTKYDDHTVMVMELCCRYIVAEAITCRFTEYATRVEAVWVREGFERATRDFRQLSESEAGTRNLQPHPGTETTDYIPRPQDLRTHYQSGGWRDMGDKEFKKLQNKGQPAVGINAGVTPPPPPKGSVGETVAAPLPPRSVALGKVLGTDKHVSTLPAPAAHPDSPAARLARKQKAEKERKEEIAQMSPKLQRRLAARKAAAVDRKNAQLMNAPSAGVILRPGRTSPYIDKHGKPLSRNSRKLLRWEKAGLDIPSWAKSGANEGVESYQELLKAYLKDHHSQAGVDSEDENLHETPMVSTQSSAGTEQEEGA